MSAKPPSCRNEEAGSIPTSPPLTRRCCTCLLKPRRLTLPSSGQATAGFACFRPPLMSDVRPHRVATRLRRTIAYESHSYRARRLCLLVVVPLGSHGGHSLEARPQQGRCGKRVHTGQLEPLALHAALGACSRELRRGAPHLRWPHACGCSSRLVLSHRPVGVCLSLRAHLSVGPSSQLVVRAGGYASVHRVRSANGHCRVLGLPSVSRVGRAVRPNTSIEQTSYSRLRLPPLAAHVER